MSKSSKPRAPSDVPAVKRDRVAHHESEIEDAALKNQREGYGGPKNKQENDRAAGNQSGLGSNASARDMTSGKHSGNQ